MRIDSAPSSIRPADDGRVGRNLRRLESAYSHTDLRRVVGQLSSAVERLQPADEAARGDSQRPPFDDRYFGAPDPPRDTTRATFPPEPHPPGEREGDAEDARDRSRDEGQGREGDATGRRQLSDDERREVQRLQEIDRQVRSREQAHLAAGAGIARASASFSYATGPDGKRYAVSSQMQVDTSPVPDNPAATLAKARQIEAAALASADTTPQDRQLAVAARRMAAEARRELLAQASEKAARARSVDDVAADSASVTPSPPAQPASPGSRSGGSATARDRVSTPLGDARVLAYTRPAPGPVGSQFSARA